MAFNGFPGYNWMTLIFADNQALLSHHQKQMQVNMTQLATNHIKTGLKIGKNQYHLLHPEITRRGADCGSEVTQAAS